MEDLGEEDGLVDLWWLILGPDLFSFFTLLYLREVQSVVWRIVNNNNNNDHTNCCMYYILGYMIINCHTPPPCKH